MKSTDKGVGVSAQTTRTKYDGVLLTIRSRKSFFEVTHAIESDLQRFHIPKLMEYVTHGDRAGVEAYVRICVSQRDGEEKRIDMDLPSALFSKFPGGTAVVCARSARREADKALRGCRCIGRHDEIASVASMTRVFILATQPFRNEDDDGWSHTRRRCFKDWERWNGSWMAKEFFLRCEMRLAVLCLLVALTASAQSTTEHLPVTDAEKIADAVEGRTKLHNRRRDYRGLSGQQGRRSQE